MERENPLENGGLLTELYQILGELGASESVLDQVLAAAQGEPLPHKTLLPFTANPSPLMACGKPLCGLPQYGGGHHPLCRHHESATQQRSVELPSGEACIGWMTDAEKEALLHAAPFAVTSLAEDGKYTLTLEFSSLQAMRDYRRALAAAPVVPAQGSLPDGITIEKDFFGTVHIKTGDFDFIQIKYDHRYTYNSHQDWVAHKIVEAVLTPPAAEQPDTDCEWCAGTGHLPTDEPCAHCAVKVPRQLLNELRAFTLEYDSGRAGQGGRGMNDVKRYDNNGMECSADYSHMRFVLASDFDALQQRCRDLEFASASHEQAAAYWKKRFDEDSSEAIDLLKSERDALRAEVERLRESEATALARQQHAESVGDNLAHALEVKCSEAARYKSQVIEETAKVIQLASELHVREVVQNRLFELCDELASDCP